MQFYFCEVCNMDKHGIVINNVEKIMQEKG
jgi:hypothetical protein